MKRRTLLKATMAVPLSGLVTPFRTLQAGEAAAACLRHGEEVLLRLPPARQLGEQLANAEQEHRRYDSMSGPARGDCADHGHDQQNQPLPRGKLIKHFNQVTF